MKNFFTPMQKSMLFVLWFFILPVYGGEQVQLEFFMQKETDVLCAIARVWEKTVNWDETFLQEQKISMNFCDEDFEQALSRFCEHRHCYYTQENGVYYVSRLFVEYKNGFITVKCEDLNPEFVLRQIGRKSGVTIMNEAFPKLNLSLNVEKASLEEVFELICRRYEGFEFDRENGAYFFKSRYQSATQSRKNDSRFSIKKHGELFSIEIAKSNLNSVVYELCRKADKEIALINRNNCSLENIKFDKDFYAALHLLLEISMCDYTEKDGIIFVFDSQSKDNAKNFRKIQTVELKNISASELMSLLPGDVNGTNLIKTDKNANRLFIYGSQAEIDSVLNLVALIDRRTENKHYKKFSFENIELSKGISMIPKNLLLSDAITLTGTSSFILLVDSEHGNEIERFIKLIDVADKTTQVNLKYISAEEILKFLPSSIDKARISLLPDENKIFFTGSESQTKDFISTVNLLDRSKRQIRYQLLVIQNQKSYNFSEGASFSLSKDFQSQAEGTTSIIGSFLNLFDVNFDVVSLFGLQAAINFNLELSNNRAKILADTTLNGISGSDISFENKNIFRYRDIITDTKATQTYSSVVREISTGLVIKINGKVSGDGMITVNVNADLSKQGTSSSSSTDGNLPTTSEKSVVTCVQTKSGKPIIISGLLQNEQDGNFSFPNVNSSRSTTELVIYLTPFLEKEDLEAEDEQEKMRRLYEKFVAI